MELEHSFTVPVPIDRAWDVLLDVERVAPCMPGASLDKVEGDEIHGRIKVKVGPINMTYAGTAKFVEVDRDGGVVRLEASGKETRGAGTAAATVRSVLEDHGAETHVVVRTTLSVTGKPAQFGRGVMNEVGGRLLTIFAQNLATTLAEGSPSTPPATPAASAASAAEAAPATVPDLMTPVADLGLFPRAEASLAREGIATVADLAAKTGDELLAIDGIGQATIDDIRAKLSERGLELGQPPSPAAAEPATAAPETEVSVPAQAPPPAETPAELHHHTARDAVHHLEEDALDLLKVAGMPVLKRALPVLAAVAAALFIGLRRKVRRRSRSAR
jgi:carbon monoxide dehydrogenase subunit G